MVFTFPDLRDRLFFVHSIFACDDTMSIISLLFYIISIFIDFYFFVHTFITPPRPLWVFWSICVETPFDQIIFYFLIFSKRTWFSSIHYISPRHLTLHVSTFCWDLIIRQLTIYPFYYNLTFLNIFIYLVLCYCTLQILRRSPYTSSLLSSFLVNFDLGYS